MSRPVPTLTQALAAWPRLPALRLSQCAICGAHSVDHANALGCVEHLRREVRRLYAEKNALHEQLDALRDIIHACNEGGAE
jgi:hypothetical protein